MDKGFIESKINIPKVKDKLVKRIALFNKLNEAINYKLILVTAPAGFGKSTLISSWLNFNVKNKYFTAWISLDERDSDSLTFWKYILYAIDKIKGGSVENSLSELNSFQFEYCLGTEILAVIINDLCNLEKDLFIVLDDLYLIKNKDIYEELKFFIRNMPFNIHFIILSRVVPEIGIGKLRATDNMLQLSQEDLCFTKEETGMFFKEVMSVNISNNILSILEKRTEGWAAGLQMAALSLKNNKYEENIIKNFKGDHRYVLDYLMEEVFTLLEKDTQEFLMKTSILDEMNCELCNKVIRAKNSQHFLEKLDNENLFMIPLDENKEWYRYHHLFKDFLRNRRDFIMKSMLPKLYSDAADWYKENGFYANGINFYLEAKNYDDAKFMIEKIDMDVMFRGEMKKVYNWCMSIPKSKLYDSPRLCMNMSWCACTNGNYEETEYYLKHVEEVLKILKDEENVKYLKAEIMIIRAMLATIEKDSRKIIEYLKKAKNYSDKYDILKATAALLNGTACIYEGNVHKALDFYEECLNISKTINNYYIAVTANRSIIISKMLRGTLYEAEKQCIDLLEYLSKRHAEKIPIAGVIYNDLAGVYYEWNELDKATECVKKALDLGKKGEIMWVLCTSYMILAKIFFANSNIEDALKYMNKAEEMMINDKLFDVRTEFEVAKGKMFLKMGNFQEAEKLINYEILNSSEKRNIAYTSYYITKLQYFILTNLLNEAEQLVSSLCESFESKSIYKEFAEVLILKSILCEKRGNTEDTLESLLKAINISYKEKYLRIFLDKGEYLKNIILKIQDKLQLRLEKEKKVFLNKIIEDFNEVTIIKKLDMIEILSIRELEVLKYLREGRTNSEIADSLFVSINTVKTHLLNIYTKLDVHSRTEALAKANELGILDM